MLDHVLHLLRDLMHVLHDLLLLGLRPLAIGLLFSFRGSSNLLGQAIRGRLRHIFSNGARHAAVAAGSLPFEALSLQPPPRPLP